MAENECGRIGKVEMASLLVHEIAYHYCPPLGLGGEACANTPMDACSDQLSAP